MRVVDKKPLEQWYPVEGTEQLVLDLELRENSMKSGTKAWTWYIILLATWVEWVSLKTTTHCVCSVFLLMFICLSTPKEHGIKDFLYSSSACAYPTYKQTEIKSAAFRSSIGRSRCLSC